MGRNTNINIAIVVVSTLTTFLQALFLSVSNFYTHISIQIVNAVLSATIVALESFQLNIKRLKSRENSRRNSSALRSTTEASAVGSVMEVQIEAEVGEK